MTKTKLILGDCLKEMDKLIEQGIKVDAIITDPPYGTTACKWDTAIPFEDMWREGNISRRSEGKRSLDGGQRYLCLVR
jgi:site-specific DNA-methyltransferase (adenine-specific)